MLRFSLSSTEFFFARVFLCVVWAQTETEDWVPGRQGLPGACPQRGRFVRATSLEDALQHFRQQSPTHLTSRGRTRKSDFQRNSNRHAHRDFRSAPRWETFEARLPPREYVTWTPLLTKSPPRPGKFEAPFESGRKFRPKKPQHDRKTPTRLSEDGAGKHQRPRLSPQT